jgi:CRISPR-associated protein Csh1
MIKEIIQFMQNLDEDFKALIYKPSKGLHIMVNLNENNEAFIEKYLHYDGESDLNSELEKITAFEKNSSYISMNQQQKFDNKQKIHSSSPFSIAFNFSLGSKKDEITKELSSKIQLNESKNNLDKLIKAYKIEEVKSRINDYFTNAKKLCLDDFKDEEFLSKLSVFENFCKGDLFEKITLLSMRKNLSKKKGEENIEEVTIFEELKEKDYVRIYFSFLEISIWAKAYITYYEKEYPPLKLKPNDFLTAYNQKKPFTKHQTATFETSLFIYGRDAKLVKDFEDLLSSQKRLVPNPLPIFIYKEELQREMIGIYKESGFSLGYKEIIQNLWKNHRNDIGDYYLLYWTKSKELFFDFDFVSKFEYELDSAPWQIVNFFDVREDKKPKIYQDLFSVFDLENNVFRVLIGNKYRNIEYFRELDSEDYKDRKSIPNKHYDCTFLSFTKYRKAVYDYVFKSKIQAVSKMAFYEMVFNSIRDDLKQNNPYAIKEKLNIWFSLYEKFDLNFNTKNNKTMASKLNDYRQFMETMAEGNADLTNASLEEFAFASGQVIDYILQKSKSADTSYQRLEPYLQQAKCEEFKKAIANDFARYKHENFSSRFQKAAAFVLTYQTDENLKKVLPEILAGVFSKSYLYSTKNHD